MKKSHLAIFLILGAISFLGCGAENRPLSESVVTEKEPIPGDTPLSPLLVYGPEYVGSLEMFNKGETRVEFNKLLSEYEAELVKQGLPAEQVKAKLAAKRVGLAAKLGAESYSAKVKFQQVPLQIRNKKVQEILTQILNENQRAEEIEAELRRGNLTPEREAELRTELDQVRVIQKIAIDFDIAVVDKPDRIWQRLAEELSKVGKFSARAVINLTDAATTPILAEPIKVFLSEKLEGDVEVEGVLYSFKKTSMDEHGNVRFNELDEFQAKDALKGYGQLSLLKPEVQNPSVPSLPPVMKPADHP